MDSAISYFLDANNCITRVSGLWDEFAVANEGDGACASAIVGRPLDAFISGDVSKMFINTMLMSARTQGKTIYRTYRCDSGRMKRFMEMAIIPQDDNGLEVRHRLLHIEPLRPYQFVPAQRNVPAGAVRIKRCSVCNKVHIALNWLEIDDAFRSNLLSPEQANGPWIFGVCPDCLERGGLSI